MDETKRCQENSEQFQAMRRLVQQLACVSLHWRHSAGSTDIQGWHPWKISSESNQDCLASPDEAPGLSGRKGIRLQPESHKERGRPSALVCADADRS